MPSPDRVVNSNANNKVTLKIHKLKRKEEPTKKY